jgi:L-threonylcarbamoyladenylate synthase
MITAQTGFVGIRIPNSEKAQALLKEAGVPVAAPSANKFGHVSPTTAEHVYKDFENDSVCILDGGHCSFGIESTVLKISKE